MPYQPNALKRPYIAFELDIPSFLSSERCYFLWRDWTITVFCQCSLGDPVLGRTASVNRVIGIGIAFTPNNIVNDIVGCHNPDNAHMSKTSSGFTSRFGPQ